jgi:hypothetical protein
MSSFYNLVLSPTQFSTRTIQAIRAGTLPVTAQLLPSFLFPDNHVYDPDDISLNVLRGHIMIRVLFVIYITLIKLEVTTSSRSQSTCFKAPRLLLSNLALIVENREMPRYAA